MENNTTSQTEVLHSENHTKLTSEEIAKAVARHNKHHPEAKAAAGEAKTKKAKKS